MCLESATRAITMSFTRANDIVWDNWISMAPGVGSATQDKVKEINQP